MNLQKMCETVYDDGFKDGERFALYNIESEISRLFDELAETLNKIKEIRNKYGEN